MRKFIVTNFAYGTGPYLRTTELAIAFNDELERRGKERLGVIIPWVYGEKQRRIMLEEFAEHDKTHSGELLLDAQLGAMLKEVFYGDNTYEEALSKWVADHDAISSHIHNHLSGTISAETLGGEKTDVSGGDIILELNRSPRVLYGVAPAYSSTFGHIAEILEALDDVGVAEVTVNRDLAKAGAQLADRIERAQGIHAIAYPATFSGAEDYKLRYPNSHLIPPITSLQHGDIGGEIDDGIFVTITGIPGLERLYEEARNLGLKLYSNDTEAVRGSEKQLPHIIPNKAIQFQFARSGWGSVWLSLFSGTPIVVPDFDPQDDPEIFFNNKMVEKLGIGIIYRGQPLSEILAARDMIRANCEAMREKIVERWGTLDGNSVCAKMFVDYFLKNQEK